MRFTKYHGLGNDYLVVDPKDLPAELTPRQIRVLCHRNYGPGSDGILLGPLPDPSADFGLRIFNPDGSEAEKSGNGLRIFSRYLFDCHKVKGAPFTLGTRGGRVRAQVDSTGSTVQVEMGTVSFDSTKIPVVGPPREVLNETLVVGGRSFSFCAATVGNPHCVLPLSSISEELARAVGPGIEVHSLFPNRTNVQLLQVLDRNNISIQIWERGAGYTLASGSSSCAAAAVARRLGLCDSRITVHMPGGLLQIEIGDDYAVQMRGPVAHVYDGELGREALDAAPENL